MTKKPVVKWQWAVPVGVLALTAGTVLLPAVASGTGHPALPARTPQELLASLASGNGTALSGTVSETARLGLPELPTDGRTASSLDWVSALTGAHTLRVWIAGPTQQRLAILGQLSESDLIRSGPDLWIYRSATNAVTHYALGDMTPTLAAADTDATNPALDPLTVANRIVAALDPSTRVSVDATEWVANRSTYQLVLTPRDDRSLVARISIAIDSATDLPLRVQIYGRNGGAPAFETGFTTIDFTKPTASVFAFSPPAGAAVTQGRIKPTSTGSASATPPTGTASPTVLGNGWTAVLSLTGVPLPVSRTSGQTGALLDLLNRVATQVPQGRILSTSLFSALLTTDGRLYLGAVSPASLQQVAASGRGL